MIILNFFVEQDLILNALVNPQVYNDERDLILSKWNQLQAFYGFGKIFYQNSGIDVNKDSRLTRFKVSLKLKKEALNV